jgi:hypothetical protein
MVRRGGGVLGSVRCIDAPSVACLALTSAGPPFSPQDRQRWRVSAAFLRHVLLPLLLSRWPLLVPAPAAFVVGPLTWPLAFT